MTKAGRRLFKAVPSAVVTLGFVSFFTDVSSEMIYPLLPVFLATTLGAGAMSLGLIEGVAESTAALFKVWSGVLTDRAATGAAKKRLIVSGYAASSTLRPLIGLATGPWMVVLLRFGDRVGKGIRSSPRDALIADVTAPEARAAAFGLNRAMDHAGSVVGPLIAWLMLESFAMDLRSVFLSAAVPAAVACAILVFGLRADAARPVVPPPKKDGRAREVLLPWRDIKAMPKTFKLFMACIALFTLGNATDAFLLLQLRALGATPGELVLIWSAQSAVKSLATWVGGQLAGRIGLRTMMVLGWTWYALCYLAMAWAPDKGTLIGVFFAYGLHYGLTEPAEKAMVAAAAPAGARGVAFGCFHFVVGTLLLPASVLFGTVWQTWSPGAAFGLGAALAALAAVLLTVWVPRRLAPEAPLPLG